MSPHALCPNSPRAGHSIEMESFGITRNAFLPDKAPLELLPDPYYEPWECIIHNLSELIAAGRVRSTILQLPVLSTTRLRSEPEWRRAYSMLAYMTHAYVWGGDDPEEILPPQIAVPFLRVSSHLELPPVLSYAAANLWNFTSTSDDFSDLEQLRTLISLTGTESEAWFLLISVAIEAQAAGVIEVMMEALGAVKTRDLDVISSALDDLRLCIDEVGRLLERMYERCDPQTFFHRVRPLMAGSKNMEAAGLPRGVFYDEGDGKGEWRHLRGGSNGQSSLIQFFDIVLGVEHRAQGNSSSKPAAPDGDKSFLTEVRDYMPGPHRRFLQHVARMGSIRELAMVGAATVTTTEEQIRLRRAYTAATDALGELRNKHIQIVTRYIILPSRQPVPGDQSKKKKKDLATMSAGRPTELTGTGGTALVPFLKQVRDETVDAGRLSTCR